MNRRISTFIAFLDSGETAHVTYKSEYIKEGIYDNVLLSCLYKGVEIEPLFRFKGTEDMPLGIYHAIENNAKSIWEKTELANY